MFVVDLAVHVYLKRRYLLTRWGVFDLAIVVITFPWYAVIPGATNTEILLIARLARVARIVVVGAKGMRGARQLVKRLGRALLYALVVMTVCAILVFRVEDGQNGFDSIGDSLWWAIVTITTVGYGDIVPGTVAGRVVASFLMISGIALLGALAGSLAAFLRLDLPEQESESKPDLHAEITQLRVEVEKLTSHLTASSEPDPPA